MSAENTTGSSKPASLFRGSLRSLLPALVCAALCVAIMRSGFFTFFFLLPLGLCAAAFGAAAAWKCLCIAAVGNAALSAGVSMVNNAGFTAAGLEILYFTVLALGFTWVMAGSPQKSGEPLFPPVRTAFRFIAASLAGALALFGMVFVIGRDESFYAYVRSVAEMVSSMYVNAAGPDAAQRTFLEYTLTPDKIIESALEIALKGGALVSVLVMFFLNRQTAFVFARLFPSQRDSRNGDLPGFHVPGKTIWVLSICLAGIVLCRLLSLKAVEIIAWNILVICAMMFLAQGGGIVLFTIARRPGLGSLRILFGILLIFIILSPGLNVLALGLLILLGIAENWLPLRAQKVVSSEQ